MTPISHAGTGLAAAGIFAPVIHLLFRIPYRAIIPITFLTSMAPDIDGLSLLFDAKIYFGKLWYSHHMMGHSLVGAGIISFIIALIYLTGAISIRGIINLFRKNKVPLEARTRRFIGALLAGFIGCLVHLAGDYPTPPGPWKGIALMWPSPVMYGGTGRIYWHNYYIIYISIFFALCIVPVHIAAGLISSIRFRITRWIGFFIRIAAVLMSLYYLDMVVTFIQKHDCATMGYQRWDALNRSLVPKEYMKIADRYQGTATVAWQRTLITQKEIVKPYNEIQHWFEELHRNMYPTIARIVPQTASASDDMALYRRLQRIAPGMDDQKPGDYRAWIIRDIFPNPTFYDRGLVSRYLGKHVLQITNAWMIIFRIEGRDAKGAVSKIRRVYHSNKIYVPSPQFPQIGLDALKASSFDFWSHDRIAYNLVPRLAYSQFHNLVKGLFPSLNTIPGYIAPGNQTGIAIHDGILSLGCTICVFSHLNLGNHLQYPYYPVWETTNRIVDIKQLGSAFRGKERVWGKVMYVRDPRPDLFGGEAKI